MFRCFLIAAILIYRSAVVFSAQADQLKLVDPAISPNLYVWTDVCNVYVWIEGRSALLIDLGDGSVVHHLQKARITIEWVLFTHHHREQCQGYALLKNGVTKIAAPEAERSFFEHPDQFLKMQPALSDPFTVYGASYIRPPVEPIVVDKGFARMDYFSWRGKDIRCIQTRGNSPGGMSYFFRTDNGWISFTGDVVMKGGLMHSWFDSEWDYGYADGLYALHNSAAVIEDYRPQLLLPSHGAVINDAKRTLSDYREKLKNIIELTLRGYDMPFSTSFQNKMATPTDVPDIWQVTPHVFVFKGPDFAPNFALILADNGKALAVDCGLLDKKFLLSRLDLMQEKMGLKTIDAVIITHLHGDHALQVPVLAQKYNTKVWTTADIADKLAFPERFNYAAMLNSYDKNLTTLKTDRILHQNESLHWEGYHLTVEQMPGQTEFALCIYGTIDGKKIVFTGDNIFGDPHDHRQSGHEAVVARNSAHLETGYITASEILMKIDPDIIVGGHAYVMENPCLMINRYHQWAYDIRDALQSASFLDDYRYWFDPYWVRFESYRQPVKVGAITKTNLIVYNYGQERQEYHISIRTPKGVSVKPDIIHTFVEPESHLFIPIEYSVIDETFEGLKRQTLDITLNNNRLGEWFDGILYVEQD